MRQPRQLSWSTRTMPSSVRLYIAPEGQEDTHVGLRQCSQMRGSQNMKESSISFFTVRFIWCRTGSSSRVAVEPPRLSSQLEDQEIVLISLPSIWDTGRAVGWVFWLAGVASSLSYS